MTTLFTDTDAVATVAVSAAHGLSRTRDVDKYLDDPRYFDTDEYRDDADRDVKRADSLLYRAAVSGNDVKLAEPQEVTQNIHCHDVRHVRYLYTTMKMDLRRLARRFWRFGSQLLKKVLH